MWVCPKCGEKLEDNFDACWKCGTLKEGVLRPAEEAQEERRPIPWERRNEIGLIKALWQTAKEILFHPGKFFDKLAGVETLSGAFSFYIATIIASILIEIAVLALSNFSTLKLFFSVLSSSLLFFVILVPIIIVAGIYISSLIMHLFVMLFRGEGGYEGTFNVMAYGCVTELWFFLLSTIAVAIISLFLMMAKFLPHAIKLFSVMITLFVVPIALLAGLLWMIAVVIIGYMRIHRLSVIRASCAFLIPVVIFVSIHQAINKGERETPESMEASLERLREAKTRVAEARARAGIMTISLGCQAYFADKGYYPSSLKDLADAKSPYIESSIAEANSASAAVGGYYYIYESLDKKHFTLYARPVETVAPGGRVFFMDQSGILRLGGPSGVSEEKTGSLKRDLDRLSSRDPGERADAALKLGERGGKQVVEPLIEALQDEYPEVRMNAIEALGRIKDKGAVESLIAALKDEKENVRSKAAQALGEIKDSRAVEPLILALGDEGKSVQLASVSALGNIGDTRAVEPIFDILKSGDKEGREYAVRALGDLKDNRAVDSLIAALKDEEYNVRMYAEEALGKIGQGAVDPLISALSDENKDFRYAAGRALGKIGISAVEPLIKTLKEADAQTRAYAAYALGKTGSDKATDALVAALKDEDMDVREFAAGALGEIKDPCAVDALIVVLNDRDDPVKCQAAYALGDIKDTRAISPLANELKQGTQAAAAAYALGNMGYPALEALTDALRSKGEVERYWAVEGLGNAKDMATVEPLIDILGDRDEFMKEFAREALKKITRKDFGYDQSSWQEWLQSENKL